MGLMTRRIWRMEIQIQWPVYVLLTIFALFYTKGGGLEQRDLVDESLIAGGADGDKYRESLMKMFLGFDDCVRL
jgi:hypothetical protein